MNDEERHAALVQHYIDANQMYFDLNRSLAEWRYNCLTDEQRDMLDQARNLIRLYVNDEWP